MIARTLGIVLLSALGCVAQEQAATLTGTVTDAFGTPIKNAKAQIESDDRNLPPYFVRTDNLGHFRLSDVTPGIYRLGVYSPEFKTAFRTGIHLFAGQQTSLASVVLNPAALVVDGCERSVDATQRLAPGDDSGTLRGSVLDNSGTPVNGAAVSVNCAGCVTTTNQVGEFAFANLWPGSYVVAISKAGYYREFLPRYDVFKNLDWTYAPIEIERCPAEGCERTPQQAKITGCG